MKDATRIISALLIALALLGMGWLAAQGMARLRTQDRFVTVKGSAERLADANLVVWPLPHSVSGTDLVEVQRRLDANTATIQRFFVDAGFPADEVLVSPPRLEDRWAYAYGENRAPERYRYSTTVTLRTEKVPQALRSLRRTGDLVSRGVLIGGEGGEGAAGGGPQFDYTELNAIKPALIAEATANARRSAEQFAKDSGARLAGIRTANQGVVSIEDRDAGSPQIKKVRVVTTVEYFLRD
jgi:hypothetical protein